MNFLRTSRYESFEDRLAFSAEPIELDAILPTASAAESITSPAVDYGLDYVRRTYGFLGAGQTVAVIDSGVAYDHPALGGGLGESYRVVGGWDFAENDADPYDDAPGGFHGTHVAGILASTHPTHRGVTPGVDLVALRVFDDRGYGEIEWVERALQWVHRNRNAFANPITVVNLSLGAEGNEVGAPPDASLEDELAQLRADGILVVASAGNSFAQYNAPGLNYPASSPHVIPVASVGPGGSLSGFSQRHARALAAPGERITSTVPDFAKNLDGVTNDFERSSGASMATPFVAGAAVLVREAMTAAGRTEITPQAIYEHLAATADTVFDPVTNASYHRVNLGRAIDAVMPTIDKADWGAVTFNEFAQQTFAGEAWRTIRTSRDGLFTVEAFFAHAAGNVDLEIYDAENRLLGSSRSHRNVERIDVTATAGQTLSLKVIGANADVDLRLTNLVAAVDGVIDVSGTAGGDRFTFATGTRHMIEVNGVQYSFAARDFAAVRFHGGRGSDFLAITGTSADERLSARPGDLSFVHSRWTVTADGVETLEAAGGGGHDTAELTDSRGDDRYFGAPEQSRLTGNGFDHRAAGFAAVQVRSSGGYDTAMLADSSGDDLFVGKPETAVWEGPGFRLDLAGFDGVRALAGRGEDRALLYDSAEADWLFARPGMTWITGRDYANFAAGFDEVHAYAHGGGYDMAWLIDSPGDDRLEARVGEVRFAGPGFHHTAVGFETVRAASSAGYDRAQFFRTHSEEFSAAHGQAMQRAGGYLNLAFGFADVAPANAAEVRQAAFAGFPRLEVDQAPRLRPRAFAAAESDEETAAVGAVFQEYGA